MVLLKTKRNSPSQKINLKYYALWISALGIIVYLWRIVDFHGRLSQLQQSVNISNSSRSSSMTQKNLPQFTTGGTTTKNRGIEFQEKGSEMINAKYPLVSAYDNGISACLLVMDDNHFLIEWLAYHYHTLPLRYLVIAEDPRSKTSPNSILGRWNDMNITIVHWSSDADFMSDAEKREAEKYVADYFGHDIGENLIRHRARQRLFYYKCMTHLKERNKDWTLLTDSDEFLLVNYPTVRRETALLGPDKEARRSSPPPPITDEGSVLTFLRSELHRPGHNLTAPCVQIPRIRFGAVESTANEIQKGVPHPSSFFPPLGFQTLRWRKHAHPDDYGNNRISKVLVDLSRVPWDELKPVDSIHRPIRSMCGQRRLHIRKSQQVFVINHYLGTLEQYQFRDDSRQGGERSLAQYNKVAKVESQTDDEIRPWLQGFIDRNGLDTATRLLKDVGVVGKLP